jgi:hypothetical protein
MRGEVSGRGKGVGHGVGLAGDPSASPDDCPMWWQLLLTVVNHPSLNSFHAVMRVGS